MYESNLGFSPISGWAFGKGGLFYKLPIEGGTILFKEDNTPIDLDEAEDLLKLILNNEIKKNATEKEKEKYKNDLADTIYYHRHKDELKEELTKDFNIVEENKANEQTEYMLNYGANELKNKIDRYIKTNNLVNSIVGYDNKINNFGNLTLYDKLKFLKETYNDIVRIATLNQPVNTKALIKADLNYLDPGQGKIFENVIMGPLKNTLMRTSGDRTKIKDENENLLLAKQNRQFTPIDLSQKNTKTELKNYWFLNKKNNKEFYDGWDYKEVLNNYDKVYPRYLELINLKTQGHDVNVKLEETKDLLKVNLPFIQKTKISGNDNIELYYQWDGERFNVGKEIIPADKSASNKKEIIIENKPVQALYNSKNGLLTYDWGIDFDNMILIDANNKKYTFEQFKTLPKKRQNEYFKMKLNYPDFDSNTYFINPHNLHRTGETLSPLRAIPEAQRQNYYKARNIGPNNYSKKTRNEAEQKLKEYFRNRKKNKDKSKTLNEDYKNLKYVKKFINR